MDCLFLRKESLSNLNLLEITPNLEFCMKQKKGLTMEGSRPFTCPLKIDSFPVKRKCISEAARRLPAGERRLLLDVLSQNN